MRLAVSLPCRLCGAGTDRAVRGETINLSRGGALIHCAPTLDLYVGRPVQIRIKLPEEPSVSQRCMDVSGVVVRRTFTDGGRLEIACEFHRMRFHEWGESDEIFAPVSKVPPGADLPAAAEYAPSAKPRPRLVSRGGNNNKKPASGNALIEFTFMVPWIFFLFVGALDLGFYSHALIATENAARVAAMYTSAGPATAADSATACLYALTELNKLPGVGASCGSKVTVTATAITGADGQPATTVTVVYNNLQMIPIPGLLAGSLNVSRTVQMRLRSST
jgi:hypothetical protein